MDWSGCEHVEVVPGKVSGQPVIKGTRVLAETIEQYSRRGASLEEIREDFPSLSVETIEGVVGYLRTRLYTAA